MQKGRPKEKVLNGETVKKQCRGATIDYKAIKCYEAIMEFFSVARMPVESMRLTNELIEREIDDMETDGVSGGHRARL